MITAYVSPTDEQTKYGGSKQWNVFSHKEEWSSEKCYKIDELWKHYMKEANHKKPHSVWFNLHKMSRIGKSVET